MKYKMSKKERIILITNLLFPFLGFLIWFLINDLNINNTLKTILYFLPTFISLTIIIIAKIKFPLNKVFKVIMIIEIVLLVLFILLCIFVIFIFTGMIKAIIGGISSGYVLGL